MWTARDAPAGAADQGLRHSGVTGCPHPDCCSFRMAGAVHKEAALCPRVEDLGSSLFSRWTWEEE